MQKGKSDKVLLIITFALLLFGIVMITSIGVPKSIQLSAPNVLYPNCDQEGVDCYLLFKNHVMRVIIGLVALIICAKIPYKFWKKAAPYLFGTIIILLLVLLIAGSTYNTIAKSWFVVLNTSVQPAEYAKLALIFYLARWMEERSREVGSFQYGFIPFCIISGLIVLPVILQPDLGSALVIILTAVSIYFIAGARIRHLLLGGLAAFLISMLVIANVSHVRERFLAYITLDKECVEDYCWQSEQANIAVGSGGIFGKGLTQGVQKSYWLPQASDDFIFAASAEELGFLRISLVVLAYLVIAYRGYKIAGSAPDKFSMLLATGITTWITAQAFVNIGVNTGLLPVTGITLPLVSYGGSSILSTLIGLGILLNISKHSTPYASNRVHGRGNRWSYYTEHRHNSEA
ncbi:cell division protein FtsW [Candidatus Peregrinibacteria bacterium]|nr:cell division protein FtsW [Candidatus Peregrinibacteria bacterium]